MEQASDEFWLEAAQNIDWIKVPTKANDVSFTSPVNIQWFEDGTLNICANCVDRHMSRHPDKKALIWEGDEPDSSTSVTYQQLHDHVCRMANSLKSLGVSKGDRVIIYMPMILEASYAMLACARIGAVHSVVFGGFSPASLASRIQDCDAKLVITADEGKRGGKLIPLKANVDEALQSCDVDSVLVVRHTQHDVAWHQERDVDYHELAQTMPTSCDVEEMQAEDPLFILYTSGSTGKPKGIVHTTGGYITYALHSFAHVFEPRPDEVYWCSADVGWITGHSYVIYAPLAHGTTSLLFEGVPNYPDYSRFWQVIDKHQVNIFYTAPTAIRALMKQGDAYLQNPKRASLRVLGSVGEPINPEAWRWYHDKVGQGRCPIVDTWWQTETGGIVISASASQDSQKAGSATSALPQIQAVLLDDKGVALNGVAEGNLCIANSWPGQARTIHGNHARFEETYFSIFEGYYFSGDGASRDVDGDYWITGRVDDVLNVSGHRLGTAEIEAAIDEHPDVAESAVVGYPHEIKGQGIYAYVILRNGAFGSDVLSKEINATIRRIVGAIASADQIHYVPDLPKTRSGKIMRRILRKIAAGESDFGDVSTLADPSVVEGLLKEVA